MRSWMLLPLVTGLTVIIPSCNTARGGCSVPCVTQTYVHTYGMKVRPDYWESQGRNGQVITTLRDGVVLSQTFVDGKLEGESTCTFPNSQDIQKREEYCNDSLKKQVVYYTSGVPATEQEWDSESRFTLRTWYESGSPRSVEKYDGGMLVSAEYFNPRNQRDAWVYNGEGERINRDTYGQFVSRDQIQGGQLVLRETNHPNGSPKEIIPYYNGVVHGERKTYYPGGEPHSIESWNSGCQNGVAVIFQNGSKYAEVPYLNGRKNGIEKRFADGCTLSQEITWFDDKMHGPTYTYVGDSIQSDWFYHGRLTTQSNFESFNFPRKTN